MRSTRLLTVASICLILGLSAGCGAVQEARKAAQRAQESNNLKMAGLMFHMHHDENQQGPGSWDEFIAYANQQGNGDVIEGLRDKGYTMVWNAKFRDAKVGTSNFVLMHQPGGGDVLLMDGSVRNMTADELNSALQAQSAP